MVRKIIDTIVKTIAVAVLLSILVFVVFKQGQNNIARRGCIDEGYHSGFATKAGVICVLHIDYTFDNKEKLEPFSQPTQ